MSENRFKSASFGSRFGLGDVEFAAVVFVGKSKSPFPKAVVRSPPAIAAARIIATMKMAKNQPSPLPMKVLCLSTKRRGAQTLFLKAARRPVGSSLSYCAGPAGACSASDIEFWCEL